MSQCVARGAVVLVCLLGSSAAQAERRTDVRLDLKTESHDTVMTSPIGGLFLGLSRAVGSPDTTLHPRLWASLGLLAGLGSGGLAMEAGGSVTYYGRARHAGLGVTLDAGSACWGSASSTTTRSFWPWRSSSNLPSSKKHRIWSPEPRK